MHPHDQVSNGPNPYSDGDIIPIDHDLTPAQRDGFGWHAMLMVGACGHCDASLLMFRVCMMDAEPSSEVENAFFHHNAECGIPHSFHASRDGGAQSWIVTRWDTPQGPMLEHEFGPFLDTDNGRWIGPIGVAMCLDGGPWTVAREFLLERWDDLRTMPKALGLAPGDPRAQVHRVAVSAVKEREQAQRLKASQTPIMFPPVYDRGDPIDDDIPF